jgi:tRNA threonylcarbamoyl adenosine modification protein YjeE
MEKLIIPTPEEMFNLWTELAKKYKIILLQWDLWAGKTLLTKWFAHGLWIDENIVQSPTYAYLNSYDNKLLHIDMYRINTEHDIWEKWLNDQIANHEYIAIERPNFIDSLDISNYVTIKIQKDWEKRIVDIIE